MGGLIGAGAGALPNAGTELSGLLAVGAPPNTNEAAGEADGAGAGVLPNAGTELSALVAVEDPPNLNVIADLAAFDASPDEGRRHRRGIRKNVRLVTRLF